MARTRRLYRIERETKSLSVDERQRIRQERAAPLLDEIRAWLDEHLPIVPPRSALGKAMHYACKPACNSDQANGVTGVQN